MNDRSWDRFTGVLLGAAIGLVAGLLLAPNSGQDTRDTIKRRTQDSLGSLKDSVNELTRTLNQRGRDLIRGGVTEIEVRDDESTLSDPGRNGV